MSNDMVRMGGIVAVALIGAITALTIFHPGDNTATITAMVAAAMGLFSALSSRTNASKIEDNGSKTDEIHEIVNGQREVMVARIEELAGIVNDLRMERSERERGREAGRETA